MVIEDMELLTVLQARMSSTRLPGKVMMDLNGKPMIIRQLSRIAQAQQVGKVIVATSKDKSDDPLADFLVSEGVEVFRGELVNVFSRFYELKERYQPRNMLRLTADCPLVMPRLIDEIVEFFNEGDYDYVSNTLLPNYPDGLDVEIFRAEVLVHLQDRQMTDSEKEHVTLGIYTRKEEFKVANYFNLAEKVTGRWTVDFPEDLEYVREIYASFVGREETFTFDEVNAVLAKN